MLFWRTHTSGRATVRCHLGISSTFSGRWIPQNTGWSSTRFLSSKTRGLSVFALHECIAAWLGGLLICLHICGANNVLTTRWHHTDVRRICLFWPMNINAKRFVSSRLQQAFAFCRHSFTPACTCFLYLCTALFFIRFLSPLLILLFDQVICFTFPLCWKHLL